MYPIFLNSPNESYNFTSFKDKMIDICNEHIQNDRALCFCMIVYDETNVGFVKMLRDDDCWTSLNKISGNYLTVFSVFKHSRTNRTKSKPKLRAKMSFKAITKINVNDLHEGNDTILSSYFNEVSEINYPSLLFFQVDNEGVSDTWVLELDEKNDYDTYDEVQKIFKCAIQGLKRIDRENKENRQSVFDQAIGELTKMKNKHTLIKLVKKYTNIKEFISSFSD